MRGGRELGRRTPRDSSVTPPSDLSSFYFSPYSLIDLRRTQAEMGARLAFLQDQNAALKQAQDDIDRESLFSFFRLILRREGHGSLPSMCCGTFQIQTP